MCIFNFRADLASGSSSGVLGNNYLLSDLDTPYKCIDLHFHPLFMEFMQ